MSDIGASGVGPVHCSASELVLLVLEQDVERGEPATAGKLISTEARVQRPEKPLLFEQLPQILKHGVFFVRARAIGDKELLAQV